ncbi:MAG: O-antigen ligase family protein [Flavobacteriales bacterium]|nr:O-antigen ligase family protein [Flavobacteriales bacterium]
MSLNENYAIKYNPYRWYPYLFVFILLFQTYVPSFKLNILLQVFVFLGLLIHQGWKIPKSLILSNQFLLLIFFVGFIGSILHLPNPKDILKDVFHFIKPITGISLGYLIFRKIKEELLIYKWIIKAGVVLSVAHIFTLIFFTDYDSVHTLRGLTKDGFFEIFAFGILVFFNNWHPNTALFSKRMKYFFMLLLVTSMILYFSRTMMVGFGILLLTQFGYTKWQKKNRNYLFFIVGLIGLFYAFLYSIKIDRNQPGLEAFLYKVKIAPAELLETKINRENHTELWDHWRGYEAKRAISLMNEHPSSYLFGVGYGSLVNLKFFAPLSDDKKGMKHISELHNGFIYLLYKTGLIGLLMYLIFLIKLYWEINRKKLTINEVLISAIGLFYLFSTLTITGLYNGKDSISILLSAFLFLKSEKN